MSPNIAVAHHSAAAFTVIHRRYSQVLRATQSRQAGIPWRPARPKRLKPDEPSIHTKLESVLRHLPWVLSHRM